ncbi:TPA: hypothetical protein ACH3X1_002488 [Trebouxia sp. C0004]
MLHLAKPNSLTEATSSACPVECMHSLLSRDSHVCRYDVVCALASDIKHDIINMVQPEWHGYYDAKVCILDQFSHYVGEDILRTGSTAILESELSNIIRPVLQDSKPIPDLLRPSLHKGADEWNPMVHAMIISCAGLVQYLIDAYPPDLPHYDPL